MSNPELVYKTSSAAALTWWADGQARTAAAYDLRDVYEKQLLLDFGPVGKRYEYDADVIDRRPLMRNSRNVVTGVLCPSGQKPPQGSGWRLDSASGFWKPDLRTKAGKERQLELDGLAGVDIAQEAEAAVGVPAIHWGENFMYRPGMSVREDTQELYVTWGSAAARSSMPQAPVNGVEWEEVPLSSWHAWREQVEAENNAEKVNA